MYMFPHILPVISRHAIINNNPRNHNNIINYEMCTFNQKEHNVKETSTKHENNFIKERKI